MAYQPKADRYDAAAKNWFRRCGRSGLLLPAISFGCWHNFGGAGTDTFGQSDESAFHENCRRMLFTAFDLGITHFDLANNYGPPPGGAEERVGRILRDDFSSHRDELIISTKAGYYMWPGPYGEWGSRKYLLASLDASLKRLKLDYVDIFYSHRPDPKTDLGETMRALDQAVRSGKALYVGISNYDASLTAMSAAVCQMEHLTPVTIHQPVYNMFDRWVEESLLHCCETHGIGMICFSPLAQGMLTDKYVSGIPAHSRAGTTTGFLRPNQVTEQKVARVRKLNEIAQRRGQSLAQMALAWVLRHRVVTSALIGASTPRQIAQNVAAVNNAPLSADELASIDSILSSGSA